jgi:hypothetical protein
MRHLMDDYMDGAWTMRHSLERTSPKGQDFVGICTLCGTPNLTFKNMQDDCPNQRGLTQEEAVLEAIEGKPRSVRVEDET